MDRKIITATVQQIFRDVLDNESLVISDHLTATEVDGWDSLAHISLLTAIEKAFSIRFSLSEIDGFSCIGDIIDCTTRKTA